MTTGPEHEARLAELADEVHRAREAEARRRVERHRTVVGVVVLAVIVLVIAIAIAVLASRGDGEPAAAPIRSTSTPSTTEPAPSTTVDPRPDEAPPVGTTPDPAAILVLVDRQRNLPADWAPPRLVAPELEWARTDSVERRLLRPEAAAAIDELGWAAARDGAPIIGISAFRSEESQRQVYEAHVRKEGAAAANTFSAAPGHSEHQTGLAIDVTGADGTCPTEPCFGLTPQAAWLEAHAPEYGFIVRYPKGKEQVTTYAAEPWHLRYVGIGPALAMQRADLTLDEYLRAA